MRLRNVILALFSILCAACAEPSATLLDRYSVIRYEPCEARGFGIYGSPEAESSAIVISDPWQGAENFTQEVFISRNGEVPPHGFRGQTIHAPVHRAVCMSSSYVAMFTALGLTDRVVGVSGREYLSDEYIRTHADAVADVGFDTSVDFELLAALRPDVVLLYGVAGENSLLTDKLEDTGIPYMYIGDYVEQSPVGKAEWMRVIGEICDCAPFAETVLDREICRYDSLRMLARTAVSRPAVILNTPYRDMWFMPPAESYMVRLIEDAGGRHIYKGHNCSVSHPVTLEEAYGMLVQSDVWLNVAAESVADLRARYPKIAELTQHTHLPPAWNNNRRSTPAGGSDFWESGVVRPSEVLADIISILHPDLLPGREQAYYSPLR